MIIWVEAEGTRWDKIKDSIRRKGGVGFFVLFTFFNCCFLFFSPKEEAWILKQFNRIYKTTLSIWIIEYCGSSPIRHIFPLSGFCYYLLVIHQFFLQLFFDVPHCEFSCHIGYPTWMSHTVPLHQLLSNWLHDLSPKQTKILCSSSSTFSLNKCQYQSPHSSDPKSQSHLDSSHLSIFSVSNQSCKTFLQ